MEDSFLFISLQGFFYSKGTLLLTGKLPPKLLLALGELKGPGSGAALQTCLALTTAGMF